MTRDYQTARRVALFGLALCAFLSVLKIWVGFQANSAATIADGVESAADMFASGLLILGLTLAARPADSNHPYGHGRFEILTGLAIGLLLCATGAGIGYRSYLHLGHSGPPPAAFALWALLVSLSSKGALSVHKLRLARRIQSSALEADGKNDFVDLVSGLTAFVALSLTLADPVRFRDADPVGGILVGCFVVLLGGQVILETSAQLVDTMPDEKQLNDIRTTAASVPEVRLVEKIHARKTGLRWHVDLHIHVDPEMSVRDSHIVAGRVKSALRTKLNWIENALIHVEPDEAG